MSHMAVCVESSRAKRACQYVPGEYSDGQRHRGLEHRERAVALSSRWLLIFPKRADGSRMKALGASHEEWPGTGMRRHR